MPARTPNSCTTSWWRFPPKTQEIQLDEKWSFVGKKEKHCDPAEEDDLFRGDQGDFVAFDPASRLVLRVVVGKRLATTAELLREDVQGRLGGRAPARVTSDEYPGYPEALLGIFGDPWRPPRTRRPARSTGPRRVPPAGMTYATVPKTRRRGRVVHVESRVVFGRVGTKERVRTASLERQNATDRHRNARKVRKTYRFSKDGDVHTALTAFTMDSYNFCGPVRTLRQRHRRGRGRPRTPAMAAGLADHVWPLEEWLTLTGAQRT